METLPLSGKTAVVTGASRGIGFAIAEALAASGCKVAVCSRNRKEIHEAAQELRKAGAEIFADSCDVSKSSDVKNFASAARKKLGDIDILVNNAGVAVYKPLKKTSEDEWDSTLDVNLKGAFLFMKEVLPQMEKKEIGRHHKHLVRRREARLRLALRILCL